MKAITSATTGRAVRSNNTAVILWVDDLLTSMLAIGCLPSMVNGGSQASAPGDIHFPACGGVCQTPAV